MDILALLWTVLSFFLGLIWQAAWFILRDVISTALWILILAWLILGVRYRSFRESAAVLLRYGIYGLRLLGRWLRGAQDAPPALPSRKAVRAQKSRYRRPFGTVAISEQLNMLLIGAIYLLFLA